MVIIEPTPRRDATVIVVHHPLQSLDIPIRQIAHGLGVIVRELKFSLSIT